MTAGAPVAPVGLLLVLGGQKSGKSSYAVGRLEATRRPLVAITPAVVRDEEFAARIARHRADRPASWRTVERFDLAAAILDVGTDAAVLIDALDTWLVETVTQLGVDLGERGPAPAALEDAEREIAARLDALIDVAHGRSGPVAVVAGQPGLGVHAMGRGARASVDLHGLALQQLSRAADEAVLLVAGRPLPLPAPLS